MSGEREPPEHPELDAWLDLEGYFWEESLDRLEDYLRQVQQQDREPGC